MTEECFAAVECEQAYAAPSEASGDIERMHPE